MIDRDSGLFLEQRLKPETCPDWTSQDDVQPSSSGFLPSIIAYTDVHPVFPSSRRRTCTDSTGPDLRVVVFLDSRSPRVPASPTHR